MASFNLLGSNPRLVLGRMKTSWVKGKNGFARLSNLIYGVLFWLYKS